MRSVRALRVRGVSARRVVELGAHLQAQLNSWGVPVNLDAVFNSFKGFSLTSQLGLVTGVVGSIVSVVLVVVISIYLLIEGRAVIATLRKLFPSHTHLFDFIALAAGSTAEAYVRGQVLMSLIIGAYITLAMELLGVHYAILLGVAAAILELVPMVGAVIAMALAVIVALLQSPALGIATAAVGLVGHALEAYVVGPRGERPCDSSASPGRDGRTPHRRRSGWCAWRTLRRADSCYRQHRAGRGVSIPSGADPLTTSVHGEIEAESSAASG